MGRKRAWPPRVRVRGGKEYILLWAGDTKHELLLGPAGSTEARANYARLVQEAELVGGALSSTPTITELAAAWLAWSLPRDEYRTYSRKVRALQTLVRVYGATEAGRFGPLALQALQAEFVREDCSRRYANHLTNSVRQLFRWAASQEVLPASVYQSLACVEGLRKRKSTARELPEVRPVDDAVVEATLPHLSGVMRDMVRLQRLTGMRPGEVCALRPCDLTRPWKTVNGVSLWLYRIDEHKTDWRGHYRWVPIGPKAQALLTPYLERGEEEYCFSPAEGRRQWEEGKHKARKTPLSCGNKPGGNRRKKPKGKPGKRYTTQSYGRRIREVCLRHGIEPWAPNRLRHAVGTQVETTHGREDSRCVLGHKNPSTTAVYAESVERAARVIAEIG